MKDTGHNKETKTPRAARLRRRAEQIVRAKMAAPADATTPEDPTRLVHELQVHQIELEMQNEELRQAQAEAAELSEKYFDLFDFAPVGYFVWDEHGRILEVNLAGAALLGLERDRLVKRRFGQFLNLNDRDLFFQFCHRVLNSDVRQTCEVRLAGGDQPVYLLVEGLAAKDRPGKQLVCRAVVTDITVHKRADELAAANRALEAEILRRSKAEEDLQKSQGLLRAILDGTPDPAYVKDRESRVLMANPALARSVGKPLAEIIGRTGGEFFENTALGEMLREHDLRVMASGQAEVMEETIPTAYGDRVFLASKAPYRNAAGEIIGVLGISRDITERKQAEEALRQSHNELRAIYEGTLDGLLVAESASTRFLRANPVMCQMLGYSEEELLRLSVADLHPPESVPDIFEQFQAMAAGRREMAVCAPMRRKDGSVFYADIGCRRLVYDGRPCVIGFFHDVTARKVAETEIQRARDAAEAANVAKSQFLANMSHELRTPMNAILGMTELALGEEVSPQVRDYMQTVKQSADSLLELLNDILDFSRIEAGRMEMEAVPFGLRGAVEQVVKSLGVRAYEKGLELICDLPRDLPDGLLGDPLRLRQILANLVSNAIKFTAKGEVVVGVEVESRVESRGSRVESGGSRAESGELREDNAVFSPGTSAGVDVTDVDGATTAPSALPTDPLSSQPPPPSTLSSRLSPAHPPVVTLHFSVSDTGIGIAPEDQRRIFAPFTQSDPSITRHYGGSGLGLSIARSLVELMGGRIWLESEPGQGSVFHFAVSMAIQQQPALVSGMAAVGPDALRDLPVLVVAESSANRRILEQMLAGVLMKPETVVDVPAALAKIHEAAAAGRRFRLILADALMTSIDGFTLAEWLRGNRRLAGPVVFMISASERHRHAQQCRDSDAVCLEKPISQSSLLSAVAAALGLERTGLGAAGQTAPPMVLSPPRRRLRVLVAEDGLAGQKLVTSILVNRGHRTETARNGQEVLDWLGREDFDLVLMDVQMPVMDGFQATAAVRALPDAAKARLPIVAVTAHALKGDRQRCLEAGMDDYISKPIDGRALIELVERLAERTPSDVGATAAQPHWPAKPRAAEVPVPSAEAADDSGLPPPVIAGGVFNFDQALSRCMDRQMFQEMVEFFFKDVADLLGQMHEGVRSGDAVGIASPAHRLRGTLVYLGAPAALAAAAEVERAANSGDVATAAAAVGPLEAHVTRLQEILTPYRRGGEQAALSGQR